MDLSNYSIGDISRIPATKEAFVLKVESDEERRVDIPIALRLDPCIVGLAVYFNSYLLYGDLTPAGRRNKLISLQDFISCFSGEENCLSRGKARLPLNAGNVFAKYLIGRGLAEITIYNKMVDIRSMLFKASSSEYESVLNIPYEDWVRINNTLKEWPRLNIPEVRSPRKGLSEKFGLDYSEQQMLLSVRLFCSWFVLEMQTIREEFKRKFPSEYEWLLTKAKSDNTIFEGALHRLGTDRQHAYAIMLQALREISSPIFRESIIISGCLSKFGNVTSSRYVDLIGGNVLSFPAPEIDPSIWCDEKFISYMESYVRDNTTVARRLVRQNGKTLTYSLGAIFSPLSLLIPSNEEQVAISWLIASERTQLSNIERIRMNDIVISNGRLHVVSFKGRNDTTQSCHFRKFEPAFKALEAHVEQMRFGYNQGLIEIDSSLSNSRLLPSINSRSFLFHHRSLSTLLLVPIVVKGSQSEAAYLNYVAGLGTSGEGRPFIECIRKAFDLNFEFSRYRLSRKYSSPGVNETKLCKPASCIYLSPQAVAQSCVLAADSNFAIDALAGISVSKNSEINIESVDDLNRDIAASRMRHNRSTASMYTDFSSCRIKINVDSLFGELVGEEMCRMAELLAQQSLDKTTMLNLTDVESLLGIPSLELLEAQVPEDVILEQAVLQDYVVEKVGIFSKDFTSYIVQSPLTLALLNAQSKHIESGLERLLSDNPSQVKKQLSLLIFYNLLIDQFDPVVKRIAQEKYGQYEFKFSDLTV